MSKENIQKFSIGLIQNGKPLEVCILGMNDPSGRAIRVLRNEDDLCTQLYTSQSQELLLGTGIVLLAGAKSDQVPKTKLSELRVEIGIIGIPGLEHDTLLSIHPDMGGTIFDGQPLSYSVWLGDHEHRLQTSNNTPTTIQITQGIDLKIMPISDTNIEVQKGYTNR